MSELSSALTPGGLNPLQPAGVPLPSLNQNTNSFGSDFSLPDFSSGIPDQSEASTDLSQSGGVVGAVGNAASSVTGLATKVSGLLSADTFERGLFVVGGLGLTFLGIWMLATSTGPSVIADALRSKIPT